MSGEAAGRGRGRPRSERARLAILAAAGELMLAGGIDAATMEAIAERAGVSKATIYKWWPNRGAVALDGFLAMVRDSIMVPEGLNTADALRFQVGALVVARLVQGAAWLTSRWQKLHCPSAFFCLWHSRHFASLGRNSVDPASVFAS